MLKRISRHDITSVLAYDRPALSAHPAPLARRAQELAVAVRLRRRAARPADLVGVAARGRGLEARLEVGVELGAEVVARRRGCELRLEGRRRRELLAA